MVQVWWRTGCGDDRFILGQFIAAKEFSVDQLYEIYMQKHALEDLAFDNEFQVGDGDLHTTGKVVHLWRWMDFSFCVDLNFSSI